MLKHLSLFFIVALLVGSCAPVPASPTPPPTATATPTITPSPAPSATPTPIPQTQEHLIVTRDHQHWALLNADGSLQKYVEVPELAGPSDVSPDGNWVVYEPGSDDKPPYDLSLNLLNLEDGTSLSITNVISRDFPKNIGPLIESMSQYDPALYGKDCADTKCRTARVKDELLSTAGLSRWSPDSQFLAFTAQIDGPSTDIYLYSMQDKTIRRLTDELQNVGWLEWSPDGKRILYSSDIPGILYERTTFHVTDLEGKTFSISQEILSKEPQWYNMHGWVSDTLYLLQALRPEPGQEHFRQLVVVNVENGETTEIWPYPTDETAIDTDNQRIVLSFIQYSFDDPIPNAPEAGTYFVSTKGDRERISGHIFSFVPDSVQIIGVDSDEGQAYHILSDGSVKRIGAGEWGFVTSSSPDKKWFFLEQREQEGAYRFSLYDDEYRQTKSWTLNEEVINASWRPDSLGIFLFTSDNIYYLAIPDGEPQLLKVEVPPWSCEGCNDIAYKWPEFTWRP